MSIITMPTDLYITTAQFKQHRFEITESSSLTGTGSSRQFGPPRWGMSLGCDNYADGDQASAWQVMILGLEGETNRLYAYDPGRRQPRGTMRGSLSLASPASQFTKTIQLSGASGTLLAGDMLQVGTGLGTSMLFKVMADVTASGGSATVSVHPPSRYSFSAGTPVYWDHPRGYFRALNKDQSWSYEPGSQLQGSFAIDLMETFN